MNRGKVTVVLDSQAGSCGKGKFIGYLAQKDNIGIAIDNFMTNAGHTYVDNDGIKYMTQHIPTSMVNKESLLFIGPGSAITPKVLLDEIVKFCNIIGDRKIYINSNAVVIKEEHKKTEERILRSGSTFKGCGAAQADKVMRQAELFGTWWRDNSYLLGDMGYTEDEIGKILSIVYVTPDSMQCINDRIDRGISVIVEGSQGCDLDINYGLGYPNTTSRQCHSGQLVADCGISPRLVDDIIMIMRPYPIRISNTTNLKNEDSTTLITSSGDYNGSEEITWDIIRERCGAPNDIEFGENTTVTKKVRRVFEMNWERLIYVTILNRPTQIALNFAQYLDYSIYRKNDPSDITKKVQDFIDMVEKYTGVPVTMIGTGERDCDIIDLRKEKL